MLADGQDRSGCAEVVRAMKAGGFFDLVMDAGPELDRVKAYLQAMACRRGWSAASALQYPDYPLFPGLEHRPFRPVAEIPGAALLQAQAGVVREEWHALQAEDYLRYSPDAMHKRWQVHLLQHMGVSLRHWHERCPRTRAVIEALPGVCLDYPWGDALFSMHSGESSLRPHCSVDNLRIRCHLAIDVPEGCAIKVAGEVREWTEGEALLFEDSFEHEVWNRSARDRTVFIVDFWHPGLTAVEREALSAGFRKSEVRLGFLHRRLQAMPWLPADFIDHLKTHIAAQDQAEGLRAYWPNA
jgi:hypothetical protein